MGLLSDRKCRTAGPGRHGDGGGLFLVVSAASARKWVLRYQLNGVRRDMGLGAFPDISLAAARAAALHARGLIAQGRDPLEARREDEKAKKPVPTFRDIASLVIADAQKRTANAKVAYQWERHLGPVYSGSLLDRPVNEITTVDIAAVLRPVWHSKPEVARKLYPAILWARRQRSARNSARRLSFVLWLQLKRLANSAADKPSCRAAARRASVFSSHVIKRRLGTMPRTATILRCPFQRRPVIGEMATFGRAAALNA